MEKSLGYTYFAISLSITNGKSIKLAGLASSFEMESPKLGDFIKRCEQGISDEHNTGAPVLAWSDIHRGKRFDNTEYITHTETWAVKDDDADDFKAEIGMWMSTTEATIFSTYWYRQLLYAHIEMYQLSELLTNGFFIELMSKDSK